MEITLPLPDPAVLVAICLLSTLGIFVVYLSFVFTRRDDQDRDFVTGLVLIAFAAMLLCIIGLVSAYLLNAN